MCDGADDPCDVFVVKWRRARKEHHCITCQEAILSKELYLYSSYVYEGMPGDYKMCARCDALLKVLHEKNKDDRFAPAYLCPELPCEETWQEVFGEEPPEDVAKLAFMNRVEVQELAGKMSAQRGA